MKKIDQLFIDFPELVLIRPWIIKAVASKKFHPIKRIYKRYRIRKPKHFDKAIKIITEGSGNGAEIMWAHMYFNRLYWGTALFKHLNLCLGKLKTIDGIHNMLNTTKNPEQFFDTLSEIEFNAYFAGRYCLLPEPKVYYSATQFKRLDSAIKLANRMVYFEIFTPKLNEKLNQINTAIFLPNRSKNKLLDKLDNQLLPIKDIVHAPIVIVVNTSYSEVDEIDIEDSILGESQITLTTNSKTGKVVNISETRQYNAIVDTRPYASCISAVLHYKRLIKPSGIEFSQGIILNKKADYPLNLKEFKALKRFDLRIPKKN